MAATHPTQGSSALKPDARYTVADYRTWTDDIRRELIHGVVYDMSPAPRVPHQRASIGMSAAVEAALRESSCEAFTAPIDVYLPTAGEGDDGDTVVQPDIIMVCNPDLVHDDGIHGAPDFVIELLSSSTAGRDLTEKRALYEEAGVREYWIVNPLDGAVLVWVRDGDRFARAREYRAGEDVPCAVVPGFVWRARSTATRGTA